MSVRSLSIRFSAAVHIVALFLLVGVLPLVQRTSANLQSEERLSMGATPSETAVATLTAVNWDEDDFEDDDEFVVPEPSEHLGARGVKSAESWRGLLPRLVVDEPHRPPIA